MKFSRDPLSLKCVSRHDVVIIKKKKKKNENIACIHFTTGMGGGEGREEKGREGGRSEFNRRVRNYFLTERSLKKFFARSRVSGTAAILSANPFVHPVALSINCFRGIRLSLSPLPPCSIVPCPISRTAFYDLTSSLNPHRLHVH